MTLAPLHAFPLAEAFLCLDCEAVGNCSTGCPACASAHLARLDTWLNRPQNNSVDLSNIGLSLTDNDEKEKTDAPTQGTL